MYVSSYSGSTASSCGSMLRPCKNLKEGVKKCRNGGIVIIEGNQAVKSEIEITHEISIIGHNGAILTGNTTRGFVFKVTEPVKFSLAELNFNEVAIVSIQSPATVNITKCFVSHSHVPKQWKDKKKNGKTI